MRIFEYQFITGITEILNVWTNDANKISVFLFIIILPVIIYLIYKSFYIAANREKKIDFYNEKLFLNYNSEFIFILVILTDAVCAAGIGQLILFDILDAAIRCLGIIIVVSSVILNLIFNYIEKINSFEIRNKSKNIFYKFVRYPEYLLFIAISLGSSLCVLNISGILITFILYLPSILLRIKFEEKNYIKKNELYINYKTDVPMIFPDIRKIVVSILINNINEK